MERKVGEVTHFFAGPSAAVLKLSGSLKVGDQIHLHGATTDFTETVRSMQIDHNSVQMAGPGDDVAILVKDRVREGDEVFVVEQGVAPSASMPAPATQVPAVRPAQMPASTAPQGAMSTPTPRPTSSPAAAPAPKPAAKPAAKKAAPKKKDLSKAKAKKKAKTKAKPKVKAKAKPKAKAKAKSKTKAKTKAKAKSKTKAKKKKR
jgi:hypothetical protein